MLKPFYIIVCWCLLMSTISVAQNENSPYSRFGIGNLNNPFLTHQIGLGGLSAAFSDAELLNYKNPASLGSLRSTSFDVGIYGRYNQLTDQVRTTEQYGGNLSYFSFAFPIKNPLNDALDRKERRFFWGAGFTLIPFSDVSYNITTTDFVPNVGRVTRQFTGTGGTYRLMLNNGWKYDDFSWGFNAGLLFGKLNRDQLVFLEDITNHFTDILEEEEVINAFTFDFGLQYDIVFNAKAAKEDNKPKKFLTLGLYGNNNQRFNSERTLLIHRANSVTNPFIRDTILFDEGVRERGTLPLSITGGAMYTHSKKYRFGLDYTFTRWSDFVQPGSTTTQLDSWQLNGGFEYIPNASSITNYLQKVRYRFGFNVGMDPRVIGDQLSFYEVTLGLGLPFVVSREVSQLHFSVSYGYLGAQNAPITERYFRFNLGYTFLDNTWFVKRRFY